jgi:GAF domain-containing protein
VVRPAAIEFEPEEQAALSLLANAAAVAIVNARLVEQGRAQAELSAAQAERERLAADSTTIWRRRSASSISRRIGWRQRSVWATHKTPSKC